MMCSPRETRVSGDIGSWVAMERKTGLSAVAAAAMGANENRERGRGEQAGHALVLRVRGLSWLGVRPRIG